MTDKNTQKSESKKAIEKAQFEEFQTIQMKIMQMNSGLIGANQLNGSYGKKGKEYSEFFMGSQDIINSKNDIFNSRKDEAEKLGISYQPNPVTDYDLIHNAKKTTNEAMNELTLGNLEKVAKSINPDLDFSVTSELTGKTFMDAYTALKNVDMDQSKIEEKMNDVLQYHKILSDAYETSSTINLMQNTSLNLYNVAGKQLAEKYASKKESKEDSN